MIKNEEFLIIPLGSFQIKMRQWMTTQQWPLFHKDALLSTYK